MAKVKVRVLNSVVDGKSAGSELSIDERSAEALASQGYVELVKEEKAKVEDKADVVKEESAPKTKATPKKSSNSRKK